MKKANFDLILGILVVTLSILATLAGYIGSNINGQGDSHTAKARQFLADANTDEGLALQYIVLDYAVFDGYYLNDGKDADAAEYYYDNFSPFLIASVERDAPFDDRYYEEMYADAEEKSKSADEEFSLADALYAKAAKLNLISLLSALGLSSASYASLLKEERRLRLVFAAIAASMFVAVVIQFLRVFAF